MPFIFSLPSNPAKEIHLHEATVSDAIDFTGIDPDFEEEASTLFLNRVQDRDTYQDSREWTGEDRRFALFQYLLNTTKTPSVALTFSYKGVEQTHDIPLQQILNTYTPLEGEAFRDFAFNGHNVVVSPLRGYDLELLEKRHAEVRALEDMIEARKGTMDTEEEHKLSGELRKKKARLFLGRICAHLDVPALDPKGTKLSRRRKTEEFVQALDTKDFTDLVERVGKALAELRHGLLCEYQEGRVVLVIPGIKPDNADGDEEITLTYPFRFVSIIPTVF